MIDLTRTIFGDNFEVINAISFTILIIDAIVNASRQIHTINIQTIIPVSICCHILFKALFIRNSEKNETHGAFTN